MGGGAGGADGAPGAWVPSGEPRPPPASEGAEPPWGHLTLLAGGAAHPFVHRTVGWRDGCPDAK